MDLRYTDEQLAVRDAMRQFARERIAPNAANWSESGRFPKEIVPELAGLGLLGLAVPTEHGGSGLDLLTIALVMEEIAAADGSIALTLGAHNSLCIGHLLAAASDEQKERWLPPLATGKWLGSWALTEPGSGSDAAAAKTRAEKRDGGWVLNGAKQFITNPNLAGFAVVIAAMAERRLVAFGIPMDRKGIRAGTPERKMGLHASDTAPLLLEGCEVPEEDRIGGLGTAFEDVKVVLDRGRIGIGAISVGLGRGALEVATRYAKERKQFGRPIGDFQMIRWKLARARTELDAARLLVHRAAVLAESGRPFRLEASMAKLYASEAGSRAADASLQVLGGYGYMRDQPIERALRDVRLMEIGEGTSEIQRVVIARGLMPG